MNKCTFNSLIIALVLLVPCVAFALPGAHGPASGNGEMACNACHISPASMGNTEATYATNVCLRCHSAQGMLTYGTLYPASTTKTFATEDYSNPFGTINTAILPAPAKPLQTSHKWFGSDVVPAAGAVKPVDTALNGLNKSANFVSGGLFCARCHNVHATSGTQSTNSPYLRYPNNQDQLCLNCHRPRDTKDHTVGTHPVNVSYTSASVKAKVAAGTFLATPASVANNVAGQVSQVKLVNSMVVCSTCHKTHNADSRSATFDPFSSGQVFGNLSSSKGYLLRVDAKGKTASDLNICTNCHAGTSGYKNHNLGLRGGKPAVQCNDCHSGHVEYDAGAVAPYNTPNVYLVRRYLQYSTAGRISKRILYNSTTTKNFYDATNKGVCQSCHNPPADHFTGSVIESGHTNCASCHTHAEQTGAFSVGAGGCNSCHGQPPKLNATGADGRDGGYTRYTNEATTPHLSHINKGLVCSDCHGAKTPGHPSTDPTTPYYFVFKPAPGSKAGTNATYTNLFPAASTCNLVYCHSDGTNLTPIAGNFINGQGAVGWNVGTAGSIIGQATECATCHLNTTISTGSHAKHASTGLRIYGCVTCHSATVSDNTTISTNANHANTIKDVQITGASPANGTFTAAGKTCAVTCHNNGKGTGPVLTPTWGSPASGACGACHATKTNGNLSTNGHAAHLTAAVTAADDTSCVSCHNTYSSYNAATHVNGTLETPVGCNTNGCHGTIAVPTWTVSLAGKDTCTKCHGTLTNTGVISVLNNNTYLFAPMTTAANPVVDAGKVSANAKKGAHETHLKYLNGFSNYSTVNYRCQGCHGTSLPASGTHANGSSSPVWATNNVATNHNQKVPVYNAGANTCSNTYCHSPAGSNGMLSAGTDSTPLWTNAGYIDNSGKNVANCGKCHGVPNGSFASHGTMTTDVGTDCAGCHGHNGDASGVVGQRHMDGIRYANGACDTCHGYPPLSAAEKAALPGGVTGVGNFENGRLASYNGSDYLDTTSSHHTAHLLATVKATDGFTPCLPCHPSTSHHNITNTVLRANVDVNTDGADLTYRFDSSRSKRYNKATLSCSNVSCHFQPTPAW